MRPLLYLGLACALSTPAHAWPVDVNVDLYVGEERFRPLSAISWVEVEDASIATAEVLEAGEVYLTARKPGRTYVLLYAEGRLAVWRVRVREQERNKVAIDAALREQDAASLHCKQFKVEDSVVRGTVPDERCRALLLALFKLDTYVAKQVELTYEIPALQSQLASITSGWEEAGLKLKASYRGAGLVLEGVLTPAEHRQVLWDVFRRSAGPVALDDQIQLSTDAGTP